MTWNFPNSYKTVIQMFVASLVTSSNVVSRLSRFVYFTDFGKFYVNFHHDENKISKNPFTMSCTFYLAIIRWKQNWKIPNTSVSNEILVKHVFSGNFGLTKSLWWRHMKTADISKKFFAPFCLFDAGVLSCKVSENMSKRLRSYGGGPICPPPSF